MHSTAVPKKNRYCSVTASSHRATAVQPAPSFITSSAAAEITRLGSREKARPAAVWVTYQLFRVTGRAWRA